MISSKMYVLCEIKTLCAYDQYRKLFYGGLYSYIQKIVAQAEVKTKH